MLIASGTEWLPTFGVLWQVVHVPVNEAGTPGMSFKPVTPEIVIGKVLNRASPRATAARAAFLSASSLPRSSPSLFDLFQLLNKLKATGVKSTPGGVPPSGSLMPTKNVCLDNAAGPPGAPRACNSPPASSKACAGAA